MSGTLIDIIKQIRKSDVYSDEQRIQQYRSNLEEYRKKFPVIEQAIAGKFHFSDVADKVRRHYGHYKPIFPMSRNRDFDNYLRENHISQIIPTDKITNDNWVCPEKKPVGRIVNYLIDFFYNPVGLMVFYGLGAAIIKPFGHESAQAQVQAFAISAGIVGMLPVIRQTYRIEKLHRDCVLLDKVIRQVYAMPQNP